MNTNNIRIGDGFGRFVKRAGAKSSAMVSLFLILSFNYCIAQPDKDYQYITKTIIGNRVTNRMLIDSVTKTRFILDTTQIYVEAIDKDGNLLWRTDPWKDSKSKSFKVLRPVIILFRIKNNVLTGNKNAIVIYYNSSLEGYLDEKTGAFTFLGQD
jgi:hypothetical protein